VRCICSIGASVFQDILPLDSQLFIRWLTDVENTLKITLMPDDFLKNCAFQDSVLQHLSAG